MMFIWGLIIMSGLSNAHYTPTDTQRKSYGLYQKIKYLASSDQKVHLTEFQN